MAARQGRARRFQISMAVGCTVIAAAGFVGAGYASSASADQAMAAASKVEPFTPSLATSSNFSDASVTGGSVNIAAAMPSVFFGQNLLVAQKPAPKTVINLDPNQANVDATISALEANAPKYSAAFISTVRKEILAATYQGLGHSYVWGGTSFNTGWDCSGFVQWVYAQAGVALPRTEQWSVMLPTKDPQPGDIVVQNPDGPNHWSHIGIYIGNGEMISALNPSVGTIMTTPQQISSSSSYFTMPGFAASDAAAKASASASASDKPTVKATTKPIAKPSPEPSKSPTAKPTTPTTPSPTPSASPSTKPSPSPSSSARPTPSASPTPSTCPLPQATAAPTPTATASPSPCPTASDATTGIESSMSPSAEAAALLSSSPSAG